VSRKAVSVAIIQTQAENAGAQVISRILAEDLEGKGYAIHQIFLYRRTKSFDSSAQVVFCSPKRPSNPFQVIACLVRLYRVLHRIRPDVVVCFQHYGNVLSAPIARLARAPAFVANQVSAADVVAPAIRIADRLLGSLAFYDKIVVNSNPASSGYENYPRRYKKRIVCIEHGFPQRKISLTKEEARKVLGIPEGWVTLGCAARLHPLKQLDSAIALLPLQPKWRLVLAGQGGDQPRLMRMAEEWGVAHRVDFLGELDATEMNAFLASLDCFVFPSAAETFGLAPVEAAEAGVPVVANKLEILREVLSVDGAPCAVFVDVRDTAQFASTVEGLLNGHELKAELRAASEKLGRRYPRATMVDSYAALLNSLIGEAACESE